MKLDITYREAHTRYPVQVAELRRLAKATSRRKEITLQLCEFTLEWCVSIDGSFHPNEMSEDEAVREYAKRCHVTLVAKQGRISRSSGPIAEVPNEILENYRQTLRKHREEMERVEALSPKEREAELEQLLEQLGKSPGFVTFKIGRP